MNLSYRAYYVWKRNLTAYKRFLLPTLLVSLGEPFFYLLALGLGLGAYMGNLFGGAAYVNFLASGLVASSCMMTATFECLYDSFVRMVHEKIYGSLIVTPISAEDVVAGDIAWGAFRGIISGFLMYGVAVLIGALPLSLPVIFGLLGVMALTGLLFGSLSMIVTSFAPNFDFFNYYTQLIISPLFFFSGVFFPLDKFPGWLRLIAKFSPLTHAVSVSRQLFAGRFSGHLYLNLLAIILPMLAAFCLALFFMKRRLIK
ncbi:MAG: ABC transporter permease [Candidatus Saganbacteria bacterium]|nr:ABC transporter permease [Candidatus Saganbacteria bacterium]